MCTHFPLNNPLPRGLVAITLVLLLSAAPLLAQRPAATPRQSAPPAPEVTFDTLLAADRYKLYGEVRNVGQLLSSGGAGEIVEPIIKLADPGPQFKSIINFLKKNSEALGSSRLMFATWAVRTDLPSVLVAIEFSNQDDAAKFAPKLEKFIPTVLPPPPSPEATPAGQSTPNSSPAPAASPKEAKPSAAPTPSPGPEQPSFVISHSGNLVFLSDKSFKFEKLHPASAKTLFQDQNFRIAHDKFSSEPVFLYFNIALEEQSKPQPSSPTKTQAELEAERAKQEEEDARTNQIAAEMASATPEPQPTSEAPKAVLMAGQSPSPSPTPTPSMEERAQKIASAQIGQLLNSLGYGEPQEPEAVGLALALDGNEYVVRALLIDKPEAKKLPIPFLPQLVSGPPYTGDAASVLPDDTEVLVSASIDLTQTHDGMRKAAELKAKEDAGPEASVYKNGVMIAPRGAKEPAPDAFAEFERKAGFKIRDELLPALGNEIALAGSLRTLQGAGVLNLGPATPSTQTAKKEENKDDAKKQAESLLPLLLIEVKDRDTMRRLMPHILTGLGIGEANLIAQTEHREDTEMVNYAGMFAYAFVGNFLVISDAAGVRRLIDANVNHQTLSANTVFHNSRRWQSQRTLGQIYISPALMQDYQDAVRAQSATMDAGLRDFLLSLDPRSEAITYALANEGLGTQHELHVPKNLIITMVAGISSATKNPPPEANETIAIMVMRIAAAAETQYKEGPGKGNYGTLQQLIDAKLMGPPEMYEKYGYKFDLTVMGDQFEAVATPREYGKTGKRSFFVDKSGVVRGDDHGGGPATIADKPVQE